MVKRGGKDGSRGKWKGRSTQYECIRFILFCDRQNLLIGAFKAQVGREEIGFHQNIVMGVGLRNRNKEGNRNNEKNLEGFSSHLSSKSLIILFAIVRHPAFFSEKTP